MNLEQIQQTMEDSIAELETGVYRYESIVKPRFEKDKELLDDMRDKHIKLMAVIQKAEKGEATQQDIMDAVPKQFQGNEQQEFKEKSLE